MSFVMVIGNVADGLAFVGPFATPDDAQRYAEEYRLDEWFTTAMTEPTAPDPLHWEACPKCGCTDVEGSAWMHLNSGKLTDSEGPISSIWCPQCQDHYDHTEIVDAPKPYRDEAEDSDA